MSEHEPEPSAGDPKPGAVAEAHPEAAPALPEAVTVLERGDTTFYLLGTAHVSQRSVDEVRAVIRGVRPDTVCVELCEARYNAMRDDSRWKNLNIFQVIRDGKTLFLFANLAIGAYQRSLGEQLGVEPGAELLAACDEAEAIGARLELVDRDIHVTLKRTWRNLGFLDKVSLLGAVFASLFERGDDVDAAAIEQLKEKAHLSEMLAEFARVMPAVKEPLIDERDRFLIGGVEAAPGERVVAVVGAAHVPGMQKWFGVPVDRDALSELPPRRWWSGLLKWIIPAVILAAFAVGWSRQEDQTFEKMLTAWILPNSIMAALMTSIALAKPLSILTAFVASPITSLNPLLGAGMVVGLVEAWQRKPTVSDAERINKDARSVRGFYRNPFTRVLLVTVMSTLGSAMGAWIGLSWVISLLP